MAELVDALGSGPSGGNTVEVRVLFWAPSKTLKPALLVDRVPVQLSTGSVTRLSCGLSSRHTASYSLTDSKLDCILHHRPTFREGTMRRPVVVRVRTQPHRPDDACTLLDRRVLSTSHTMLSVETHQVQQPSVTPSALRWSAHPYSKIQSLSGS